MHNPRLVSTGMGHVYWWRFQTLVILFSMIQIIVHMTLNNVKTQLLSDSHIKIFAVFARHFLKDFIKFHYDEYEQLSSDVYSMINYFFNYFENICQFVSSCEYRPLATIIYLDYLCKNKILNIVVSYYSKMTDINITQHGIQKMLENLNPHKATGPDDICPLFLKTLASSIAPILMIVYKKSYNTGKLPDDWKSANVVTVFKKGNTSLAANYRPISLTCVSCKIMEHIITSNVMRHASTHNILYHLQHGFRDKRSCETQVEFQNDIVANMNTFMTLSFNK